MGDITLQSVPKDKEAMADISNAFIHLNKTVVKNLLLIHAWGGCDTT